MAAVWGSFGPSESVATVGAAPAPVDCHRSPTKYGFAAVAADARRKEVAAGTAGSTRPPVVARRTAEARTAGEERVSTRRILKEEEAEQKNRSAHTDTHTQTHTPNAPRPSVSVVLLRVVRSTGNGRICGPCRRRAQPLVPRVWRGVCIRVVGACTRLSSLCLFVCVLVWLLGVVSPLLLSAALPLLFCFR
jgi:hypothetical protein